MNAKYMTVNEIQAMLWLNGGGIDEITFHCYGDKFIWFWLEKHKYDVIFLLYSCDKIQNTNTIKSARAAFT